MSGRIFIQCSSCGAKLSVSDETKLGKKIRCPKCSEVFVANAIRPPSVQGKTKRVKRSDDEFDFGDMEMEDTANPVSLPPARRKNSAARQGAPANSSPSRFPLILGAVAAALLFTSVGGFLFFKQGNGSEESAPATQDVSSTAPQIGNSPVLPSPAVNPSSSEAPTGPSMAEMPGPIGAVGTVGVAPGGSSQAPAVAENRYGETPEFQATAGENPEAGIARVSGRTRWNSMLSIDESGQKQDVIVLLIDLEGDLLSQTIAIGKAKFTKLEVSPGISLTPFKGFPGDPFDSSRYSPYAPNSLRIWEQPPGTLRTGLRFIAPRDPVMAMAEVEGVVTVKVGKKAEEITIPDLRTAANKPFAQASLRTARAELFFKSQQQGDRLAEVFDFRIGKKAAVGPLMATSSTFPIELQPDYNIDPDGYHYSTRHLLNLPQGLLKMTFNVFSDIEEISVPFRFENMPLPDIAKKAR